MRRSVWTTTCAAIVGLATAGMLAQSTAQTASPQQSTPPGSDSKVTVTGCLKAAPSAARDTVAAETPTGTAGTAGTSAPGTTGTAGAAPTDAKFILTAATMVPANNTSDTSSTPSTPSNSSTTAQTYRLIANPAALSAHVGKKLELTGTIDAASTADPKDPSAAAPALRVESGKIVGASCSE